jgi:phosphoserine phosphatase RsbU/P
LRVLIAEDDFTSRNILSGMLKKFGHEVVETTDGLVALEALRADDGPLLAVLDWMMPGIDGVEVCRRLREARLDRPRYLILLTKRDEKRDIVEGLGAGADDYLTKPFDPEELRARIDVGIRMTALQGQLADKIRELRDAISHIKTLRGIVPICSHCKKIRDDQGYWNQVDAYVRKHSEAEFSHGICPDCLRLLYPDIADRLDLEDEEDGAG